VKILSTAKKKYSGNVSVKDFWKSVYTSTDYDYNIASTAKSRIPKVHVDVCLLQHFSGWSCSSCSISLFSSVQNNNTFLIASFSEVVVLIVSSDLVCSAYCNVSQQLTAVDWHWSWRVVSDLSSTTQLRLSGWLSEQLRCLKLSCCRLWYFGCWLSCFRPHRRAKRRCGLLLLLTSG